ncbi:MAG: phosphoadenosine phosphosulfate reductase family protein [Lachnospiraceae bacterium]
MIQYFCKECNVFMETSECSICKNRTEVLSKLFWCSECNIPVFWEKCPCCKQEGFYIGTDIRPVFPKEKLLIGIILNNKKPLSLQCSSVWAGTGFYIIDGKKVTLSSTKLNSLPLEKIVKIKEQYDLHIDEVDNDFFAETRRRFVEVNRLRYEEINDESVRYIKSFLGQYSLDEMFVSFSGGKDSTVISHLVTKSLGSRRVLHIFGDTTLEHELTYDYKKRFLQNDESKGVPMISARNTEKNFEELCETVGPPSRVMRWCCTVFKTGAITRKISAAFKNKTDILTFYGIRRSESVSRSKYDRESDSPKIAKQTVVSPIIDWIDFDVWLYILTEGIDFNEAYELGYSRVGCWCCPNNGSWSEFLSKLHMYDKYYNWRELLLNFAIQTDKLEPEKYVDEGSWKARQGGNGLEVAQKSIISFEPCATEDNAFNYELQKPISEELYELFKPFGFINKELGNKRLGEVYILDKKGRVVLILQGRIGSYKLKVTIKKINIAKARTMQAAERKIQCQITKYQMCMGCRACEGVCKYSAISVKDLPDGATEYKIDNEKCVRCGECVGHFDAGCYMRKVLGIKRG